MMRSDSFDIQRLKRLTNKPRRMRRHSAGVLVAVLIAALSLVNISASAQGDAFTVCPDDIETSSVMQADEGARLKITLRDSAADRLSEATVDRVGERMVLTDSRGTVLEGVSLTIQAPLHKAVQLVLSSEPTAMRLQSYFQGDQCTYE